MSSPTLPKGELIFFLMKIFLTCFFCVLSILGTAQPWIKSYATDYWADWVTEDYDKGYLIIGTKSTARYGLIIKTDINGNQLWSKYIGNGLYNMFPSNIELTPDNGLVLGGTITKYGNQQDACIMKLNACGQLEWCTDIYTPSIPSDLEWMVKPTVDNGFILLGELNDPNPKLRTNLFKFNSVGNLEWHQAYLPDSAAFDDDASGVLVDSTGFLVTAVVYYPDPGQIGGYERFYFIKTDSLGNKLWTNIYGKSSYYYGSPLTSTKSSRSNYYGLGWHDNFTINKSVPAMVKVLNNGLSSYNKDIYININDFGGISSANWLNDNAMILGGGWGISTSYSVNVMFITDTLGNLLQSHILDTTSQGIVSTAKSFDNKFVSVATDYVNHHDVIIAYKVNSTLQWDSIYTHPYTYDSLCPNPIVSDTIDPSCNLVVNIEEPLNNPETHQMNIFPNPTKGKLTVILPKYILVRDNTPPIKSETIYHQWKSTILYAYDLNGNQVFQKEIPMNEPQLELHVSGWAKGMYFFKLVYNGNSVDEKKIIVN